jgi:NADPH:quinone reductase-like Zn-dependent oxidoreductase
MQAIIHTRFGAPSEVLQFGDTEVPAAEADGVLVRVRAAAVSKGDWLITQGLPFMARPMYGIRAPKQRVAGLEFSGVVETAGSEADAFRPGDEVFGWGNGAMAELVAVPAAQVAPKPGAITFEQAAAVPVSGFAALQAVRDRGEVGPGSRVLVIGASGGVGSFAVQIAKAFGAEVTGVCSTRNVDLVRSLGADHVIDYTRQEITAGGRRFDVILDIAGNRPLSVLRRALEPDGTLVVVGGSGGRWTMGFGRTVRATLLSPLVRQRLRPLISSPNGADLEVLADLMASGRIAPLVGAGYPLREAAEAIGLVGAGRSSGKTVVTP